MKPGALAPHVRSIRERYASGNVTQEELAIEHGCTPQAISNVVRDLAYAGPEHDEHPRREYHPAIARVAVHDRWCCDCRGRFKQHEYESVPFRAMVRCAPCASKLWAKRQARASKVVGN